VHRVVYEYECGVIQQITQLKSTSSDSDRSYLHALTLLLNFNCLTSNRFIVSIVLSSVLLLFYLANTQMKLKRHAERIE